MLEADVQRVGLATLGNVAGDLERIVVLPVPCAPPMSISSPERIPPPSVRSRGVMPSGMGWYSVTAPALTLSDMPPSTSTALRGRSGVALEPDCQSAGPCAPFTRD